MLVITRQEQIIEAAKQEEKKLGFAQIVKDAKGVNSAYGIGFLEGAKWADEHSIELKEVDLEKEYEEFVVDDPIFGNFITNDTMGMKLAKHFFELGLKIQKGE